MSARESGPKAVDLLVIGGGINGACIARDAAGRGLDVLLCEKDDLAAHTSSASTKLIHGGLRYLEHYDFRLVRHSLREREVLLRNAPHIIWPMRFVLPHHAGLRPRWMIRLGLFLYDHLGGRALLPPSTGIDLRRHPSGRPLKKHYRRGYEYSDCWVQDARLVVLNARDAHLRGADVRTRTECVSLVHRGPHWEATLVDRTTGARSTVSARGGRQRERTVGRQEAGSGRGCGRRRETRCRAHERQRHGWGHVLGRQGREARREAHDGQRRGRWSHILGRRRYEARRPAREGQPHRRREGVRSSLPLHLPGHGRARAVRDPFRGGLHPAWNHRGGDRGRSGAGRDHFR